tara:strand:- start:1604 stop:2065 length:462 start_codon:yes stop_codon:yes gene_type:complete
MTASISFRVATVADAPLIARIHREARTVAMPWLPVMHTPAEDLAFFRDEVLAAGMTELGLLESQPVGFCTRQADWIDHLYLLPSAWRCGLGSALLRRAQAASPHLQLWTFQRNLVARHFYESHDCRAAEFTDGARNEESEPDVRYVWERGGIA